MIFTEDIFKSLIDAGNKVTYIISYLLLFILIVELLKLSKTLHIYIKKYINMNKNIENWENGIFTIDDIHTLTPKEFVHLCIELLNLNEYKNIKYIYSRNNSSLLSCTKNNEKLYVYCNKCSKKDLSVKKDSCAKLVGNMAKDNINKGILLTNGIPSNDVFKYINKLPANYSIEVLDYNNLIIKYNDLNLSFT